MKPHLVHMDKRWCVGRGRAWSGLPVGVGLTVREAWTSFQDMEQQATRIKARYA